MFVTKQDISLVTSVYAEQRIVLECVVVFLPGVVERSSLAIVFHMLLEKHAFATFGLSL